MGLKFTPTPEKSNISELDDDLNKFVRKIDYKSIFMVKSKRTFH